MSFNTYQPSYNFKPNTNPIDNNTNTNNTHHYQPNIQKTQTNKTSEFTNSHFNTPSSINSNYLNPQSKFTTPKFTPSNIQKKDDSWKNSDMMTAKSMVFTGAQYDSGTSNLPKKTLGGLGKLSSMARTVNNNFDDAADLDHGKNSNPQQNSNNFQEQKPAPFKKYGNTLGQQFGNFKNYHEKQPSVTSSMFFNVGQEKNNVYKSYINMGSNNSTGLDNKKSGGLDFLLKYKKEQQQKKQKQLNNAKSNEEKQFDSPKINDNGNKNFLNPSDNAHNKLFHQYSAPDLGHIQKNHHYQPIKTPQFSKNQLNSQSNNKQYQSPVHGSINQNSYNNSNLNNKYSSPQQAPNQTFMKKFNSDKVDNRYSQIKSFGSDPNIPSSTGYQGVSNFPTNMTFAKKQKKINQEFISSPEQNSNQDKFMSPAFFKNKQAKIYSDAKTLETIPSPNSAKVSEFSDRGQSPTHIKSALSDDGSNDSIEYMDGDFSSDQAKEWSLDDFELGDKLGKGAFGDVFIARQKHLGFMCVLKKMSKKRIKDLKREQHVIRQLKIQMFLNHKYLTAMYGYFHDKDNIYLILEYLPDGNLAQIKKRKKTSQKQTAQILKQVCEGLAFMHKNNIIHRDIKPQNIFCNQGNIKLGDFGCSVFTDGMRKTVVSCLEYSSPQQLSGGSYNEKIDVWGIGILAYELLTGKSPFQKEIMNMANEEVDFASALKFPEQLKLSQLAKDFITSLLSIDPIDRLDVEQALQHKFIVSNIKQPVALK